MILIGLTGGIACGKSTVSSLLQEKYQIHIIDADRLVRELQTAGAPCTRKIARQWPQCVDPVTGELDRAALGAIVFESKEARKKLADIMNGPIFWTIFSEIWKAWLRSGSRTVVVLDAPTLFETAIFTHFISGAVVVSCSEEKQIERLQSRNNYSRPESLNRIRSQMPLEAKRKRAGFVIENNSNSIDALKTAVDDSVRWMEKQSSHKLTFMAWGSLLAVAVPIVAIGVTWRR
uniref:Dephospho-CoA kinase n=1 Tax=Angomonas desouzai TaxID=59800 RepID=T1YT22_9TRYP|nr:dephospho-CoA kinase [Angomonas desouzai]